MPIRSVAILALPDVRPFELGVAWEGFGLVRYDDGVPNYDCVIVSEERTVPTSAGYTRTVEHGLDRAQNADLVIVPANGEDPVVTDAVVQLLRDTVERGGKVMSVC